MCGIAGQYCYHGNMPDIGLVARMSALLAHRGPDADDAFSNGTVALAHRRLAIIDLSDDGRQPMANEDGSIRIVYNGEIYNYVELREELIRIGHTFSSRSDTEVILHAYEEWGRECLSRFNGMWAFAIWDGRKQELICARDRFGIKPFYYTEAAGSFLFASEIKALLAHPEAGLHPDEEMLAAFLAFGVLDHSEKTMFSGIFQIRPGHALVVTREGMHPPFRYWDVTVNPEVAPAEGWVDDTSRLLPLLEDAVRVHLRSDVAVGTCLSGGIDSSTLTILINNLIRHEAPQSVGARQKTFSAVFTDPRFDESRYIRELVAATGVDADCTEPSPHQLSADLERLLYHQDEPFGSLSIYAQYCVMRLAQKKVKVVLDGQGADELLAGYLGYQGTYIRQLASGGRILAALREACGSLRRHACFFTDAWRQLRVRTERRSLLRIAAPPIDRYAGSLDAVLKAELVSTNLPALLHYEDRNAMAFSIESRVPYLDVRFAEYCCALPLSAKIRCGVTKATLRDAIRGIVPESIRNRMDKMGFVTPEEVWMREELQPLVLELLASPSFRCRPYWDAAAVEQNYRRFLAGSSAYSQDLWRIVCTELWLRMFFDRREATIPA